LKIAANGTNSGASIIGSLAIAGTIDAWSATLDLNDNAMILSYTGASPLATVQNQIKSGSASGAWTGMGITSSSAAAVAADGLNPNKTALGFAEASSLGLSSFFGQPIAGDAIIIRYTLTGDANLDGTVNSFDYGALVGNFGASGATWIDADFNYDGTVNSLDFNSLAVNFNYTMPAPASFASLVPEPAAAGLLATCLVTRRRTKQIEPRRHEDTKGRL